MLSLHTERTNERANDMKFRKWQTLLALVIFLWQFSRPSASSVRVLSRIGARMVAMTILPSFRNTHLLHPATGFLIAAASFFSLHFIWSVRLVVHFYSHLASMRHGFGNMCVGEGYAHKGYIVIVVHRVYTFARIKMKTSHSPVAIVSNKNSEYVQYERRWIPGTTIQCTVTTGSSVTFKIQKPTTINRQKWHKTRRRKKTQQTQPNKREEKTHRTNLDGTKLKSINLTAKRLLCVQFSFVSNVCRDFS